MNALAPDKTRFSYAQATVYVPTGREPLYVVTEWRHNIWQIISPAMPLASVIARVEDYRTQEREGTV